jgi:hypothetical protein
MGNVVSTVLRSMTCVLAFVVAAGLATSTLHDAHAHGATDDPHAHPDCPACAASAFPAIPASIELAPPIATVAEMLAPTHASPMHTFETRIPPERGPPLLS